VLVRDADERYGKFGEEGKIWFLIMDNSTVHHAKILKEYAKENSGMLRFYSLSTYSPDLNPDEQEWRNVKHDNLGRTPNKSESEFAEFARAALLKLKAMPAKVRDIFRRIPPSDTSVSYCVSFRNKFLLRSWKVQGRSNGYGIRIFHGGASRIDP
jgi:transposase